MNASARSNALFERECLEHVGDISLVGNHAEGVGTARYVFHGNLTVRSDLTAATGYLALVLLPFSRGEDGYIKVDQLVSVQNEVPAFPHAQTSEALLHQVPLQMDFQQELRGVGCTHTVDIHLRHCGNVHPIHYQTLLHPATLRRWIEAVIIRDHLSDRIEEGVSWTPDWRHHWRRPNGPIRQGGLLHRLCTAIIVTDRIVAFQHQNVFITFQYLQRQAIHETLKRVCNKQVKDYRILPCSYQFPYRADYKLLESIPSIRILKINQQQRIVILCIIHASERIQHLRFSRLAEPHCIPSLC